MNPYRYVKKIRTEWLHEGGGYPSDDLNIDLLLERATVPPCQRIGKLESYLKSIRDGIDSDPCWTFDDGMEANLRTLLEETNENP